MGRFGSACLLLATSAVCAEVPWKVGDTKSRVEIRQTSPIRNPRPGCRASAMTPSGKDAQHAMQPVLMAVGGIQLGSRSRKRSWRSTRVSGVEIWLSPRHVTAGFMIACTCSAGAKRTELSCC